MIDGAPIVIFSTVRQADRECLRNALYLSPSGAIDRWLTTRLLLPINRRELDRLEALAKEGTEHP